MLVPCRWEPAESGGSFWLKAGNSVIGKVWEFKCTGDRHWVDHEDMYPRHKTKEDAMRAVEARLGVRRD